MYDCSISTKNNVHHRGIKVTITINILHTADYNITYRSPIHELTEASIVLFPAIGTSGRASAVLLLCHYFINRAINHVRLYLPICFITLRNNIMRIRVDGNSGPLDFP